MEQIYMKGHPGPRKWCSDIVEFDSYFETYSDALKIFHKTRLSEINVLQLFVPQASDLSKSDFNRMMEDIDGARLCDLSEEDLKKKSKVSRNEPVPSTSSNEDIKRDCFRKFTNKVESASSFSLRKEIIIKNDNAEGRKTLSSKKNFIVSFRVHEPFSQRSESRKKTRPGRCVQQIWVLGNQKLTDLRDKIICESDYLDVRGDISTCPDVPSDVKAIDLFPSSMFYFDNNFYIDKRKRENEDYSTTIRKWGKSREIEFGDTLRMECTRVDELRVRMGYPYLFLHQGCCEHIVIINDARLLTNKDSLCAMDYPLTARITRSNVTYCMTCSRNPARWIVRNSSRLPHDPAFQCGNCFRMYHYINGNKIGKFKAYPYLVRSTIF